jgi:two-component system, sensor histidine kinase and response regulator
VLDFSKIEAGRLEIEVLDFDPRRLVEDAADIVAPQAHAKGLELVTLVAPEVPQVACGDPGRLRQVLLNLVGNAVKFTEEGEVVIHVGVAHASEDGVVVRFEVADTGVGLSADQQKEVFDSFAQADASTTRRYGGTGLGLAISKQLVGLMDGEVGVESELGTGSRFWFTAKLGRAPEPEPTALPDRTALEGVRALVVDDSAASRTALHQVVAESGMRVSTAASAGAALAALHDAAHEADPYVVAIIDFEMPGTDGLELARAIADDPMVGDTRMVLLTGSGHRGEAKAAKHAGVAAYLTKPVHQESLYDCLAMVLGHNGDEPPTMVTRHTVAEAGAQARAHVLIVDDNAVNQKVSVVMLERLGYRVDVATNGFEAVQAVDRTPYAAVIMDCQMPEMDGYEATRHIRARSSTRRMPIIALTAGATKEDEAKTREAGMDDFLTKPVTKEALAGVLGRWIT